MDLVILAAGHGRRFGGLKQLQPVGPNDEAIMDYTVRDAEACGFDHIVVVVRDEILEEIRAHTTRYWPGSLAVDFICQPPVPGTAQAVLCTRGSINSHFGVVNADDLYGAQAIERCAEHFSKGEDGRHVLVAYQLRRTILTSAEVTRGLCELNSEGELRRIVEHRVTKFGDDSFEATPIDEDPDIGRKTLRGDERVSMNLWGFHTRIFDELEDALEAFGSNDGQSGEFLLPSVIGDLVSSGSDVVRAVSTEDHCVGITHRDDLPIVRELVANIGLTGELNNANDLS